MTKRRVALLDWDGSLCNGAVIFSWSKYLNDRGIMSDEGMTTVASVFDDFEQGRISYRELIDGATSGYTRGLIGRRMEELSALTQEFAESYKHQIMWFAPGLIGALLKASIEPVVITGSPGIAVRPLAQRLGIDRVIGLQHFLIGGALASYPPPQNTARPEFKRQIVKDEFGGDVVTLALANSLADEPLLEAAQVRLLVGDGPMPSLDRIVRIPRIASPQAREDLGIAVAEATRSGVQGRPPVQGSHLNA